MSAATVDSQMARLQAGCHELRGALILSSNWHALTEEVTPR
jgi:hypothetical protein